MMFNVLFQVTQVVGYSTIEVYLWGTEKPTCKINFFLYKPNRISRYLSIFLLNPLSVKLYSYQLYYV